MKGIAIILLGSLFFLSAEQLRESILAPEVQSEISCSSDCCDAHDEHHDGEEPCHGDHSCLPGCDCIHHFHVFAINYRFLEFPGTVVQSYIYGSYMNSYSFEFSTAFLQPPRFG